MREDKNHAPKRDYTAVIKALLKAGANPNIKDNDGNTPLHVAAVSGQTEAITALLKAGANPHIKNNAGHRPIDIARLFEHHEAYEVLKLAE